MEFLFIKFIEHFILPPGIFIVIVAIGLVLTLYRKRPGITIISSSLILWYISSTSVFSTMLLDSLEKYPALSQEYIQTAPADAIIVLSAGYYKDSHEYDGPTVDKFTLERLRYAAYLHHQTNLPVIVSGGTLRPTQTKSHAELMRHALIFDFNVPTVILEDKSKTTFENAKYSAQIAQANNFKRSYLVTHSFHMQRAVEAFKHFKVSVIPAPTVISGGGERRIGLDDLLPSAKAQLETSMALHEMIGRIWYQIRYY